MQRILFLVLSCLIAGSTWGQHSTQLFPTLGERYLETQGLIETSNSLFFPSMKFGSIERPNFSPYVKIYPGVAILYKYDKKTSNFTDSVVMAGDTIEKYSIYTTNNVASCYHDGKMYFVRVKNFYLPDSGIVTGTRLFLSIVDTNLNVLLSDKMLFDPSLSLNFKSVLRLTYFQGKLLGTYDQTDFSSQTRVFLVNTDGSFVKETAPKNLPSTGATVTGLISNPYNTSELYIGGTSLGNCITCLYKTDTNLNVLADYGPLNPLPSSGPAGMFVNEAVFGTSYSDIIDDQLFTAGEYSIKDGPCFAQLQQHLFFTFLSKHRKRDGFKRSKELLIPNSSCIKNSGNSASASKVLYSKNSNQIYYVNYNFNSNLLSPDTEQNQIQIVCADTNLNLKWHKLVSPKPSTRVLLSQSLTPIEGLGLTIIGSYFDIGNPGDSTLSGTFLLRFDSAGLLSTGSNPQFTVRDRFNVYPNPATNAIWVEDIASVPAQAFIYDLVGRQVAAYSLTGRKNRLELPTGKPGMYLLRIVPQWGEGWSQMVQVTE